MLHCLNSAYQGSPQYKKCNIHTLMNDATNEQQRHSLYENNQSYQKKKLTKAVYGSNKRANTVHFKCHIFMNL